MAKVTSPLFSFDARGQVGKAVVYSIWKGINYVRQYAIPGYSNTTDQATIRGLITELSQAWKLGSTVDSVAIDAAYKLAYNTAASGTPMSGFNLFIKEGVAKNEGVSYGGTLDVPTAPGDITPDV